MWNCCLNGATSFPSPAENTGICGTEIETCSDANVVLSLFLSAVAWREKTKELPPHFHQAAGPITVISIFPWWLEGGGPASCGDSISLWDAGTMHVIDLILASGKGKLKQFPKELLPAYIHCPWTAGCDWLIFSTHKGPTTAFLGLLKLSWVLVFAEPPQKSILFPPKQWHLNLLWAGSALSQKNSSFPNITKCLDSSGGADTGLLVCEHSNGWCGKNRDTNILTRNLFGWKDVSLVTPNPAVK